LTTGDHLCCIYRTEAEHRQVVSAFVRAGLQANHKILYILDAHSAETITHSLKQADLDPTLAIESGQIELLTSRETYTRGGAFDPDAMVESLRLRTSDALSEGYEALRVTGEMTWALSDLPGTERLIEYENRLNEFMPANACLAICQYDRKAFSPEVLLDILRTHPYAIIGTRVFENFYFLPPEDLLGVDPAAAELENWIANLEKRAEADAALAYERRLAEALLETSGALVVFLDTDGCIVRVNRACREISGYTESELVGGSIYHFIPAEEQAGVRRVVAELLDGNHPNTHENHWITKTGERRLIAWSNTAICEDARLTGVIATGIDITERERSKRERIEHLEAELVRLGAYAGDTPTAVTGGLYRQGSVREGCPDEFGDMLATYKGILTDALEQRMYKVDYDIRPRLQSLAQCLGRLSAGPRDVVELHVKVLKGMTAGASSARSQALNDEARLIALELMGYLVTEYRNKVVDHNGGCE